MKILVTAGNTQTPLDRVRCITNIFSGRTGTSIAREAHRCGHDVCFLTSHPDLAASDDDGSDSEWQVHAFRTFEDLRERMAASLSRSAFDCVIHCAAVSDYALGGVYVPASGTSFNSRGGTWTVATAMEKPQLEDASAGKVKSHHDELWMRLLPTPKLIDMIRCSWNHRGILVKFKLEVGISEQELLEIAEASRLHSSADLIVANTLEEMHSWAYVGSDRGKYTKVDRAALALRLIRAIEEEFRCQSCQANAA
jgi:phosphopantothenoylcysteine synthetase/decarboxylase